MCLCTEYNLYLNLPTPFWIFSNSNSVKKNISPMFLKIANLYSSPNLMFHYIEINDQCPIVREIASSK